MVPAKAGELVEAAGNGLEAAEECARQGRCSRPSAVHPWLLLSNGLEGAPGTPESKRLLGNSVCNAPCQDKEGFPIRWGTVAYDFLFNDKTGWCNAEHPTGRCDCYQVRRDGAGNGVRAPLVTTH